MVTPQSKPFASGKIVSARDRDSAPPISSSESGNGSGSVSLHLDRNLDENQALSALKQLVAAGNHRLEPMLGTIADAARQLTGASGAALAMWKDGAMVCRARSGETAPALGARLNASTGISGECLRTGKVQHCSDSENDPLVDVEVCRRLGLRSITVLPIQGWRGINGILEVFSTRPGAFTEVHIGLLEQLAALAERARAAQPHDASPTAPKITSAHEPSQPAHSSRSSGLLPASDRVGDVALAVVGKRSQPWVIGAIGVAAILLLASVIWLGWRTPDEVDRPHAAAPVNSGASGSAVTSSNLVTARASLQNSSSANSLRTNPAFGSIAGANSSDPRSHAQHPQQHPQNDDPLLKVNPGGELLFSSSGKPSPGTSVKFASKVDVIVANKTDSHAQALLADDAAKVAADPSIMRAASSSGADSPNESNAASQPGSQTPDSQSAVHPDPTDQAVQPPAISAGLTNPSSLTTVLTAKVSFPNLVAPLSTGVSGGQLIRRVEPDYPVQARLLHLKGKVVVAALVNENGTVGEVKVVDGPQMLAPSVVEAVKQWRYKPYELDGKPVKSEVTIEVNFHF